MISPSKDAAFLNRVINDPAVFPWISLGLKPPFDLTEAVENDANVFLANEYGGFLYIAKPDYIYEVHTQFLPKSPGVTGLAKESLFHMFTKTDALRIDTTVSVSNIPAKRLTLAVGFTKWGDIEVLGQPSEYYVLTIKQWARSLCQLQQ